MATQTQLTQLYLAYFGRPPDFDGLQFYSTWSVQAVTNAFSASPESLALYGGVFGAAQINQIYLNLFNRPAEPAGLLYWENEVASGRLTAAGAALAILQGAQNSDLTTVNNKLQLSALWIAHLDTNAEIIGYSGTAAAAIARAFLSTVDATAGSVTAATAALDAAIANAVAVGGLAGVTKDFTTGIDNLVGTAGNDTFQGTETTITGLDKADGMNGIDSVNLFDTKGSTLNLGLVTLSNMERLFLESTTGLLGNAVSIAGIAGLQSGTFTLHGLTGDTTITAGASTTLTVDEANGGKWDMTTNGGSIVMVNQFNQSDNSGQAIMVNGGSGTTSATVTQVGPGTSAYVQIMDQHYIDGTKAPTITSAAVSGLKDNMADIWADKLAALSVTNTTDDVIVHALAGTRTLAVQINGLGDASDVEDGEATTVNISTTGKASTGDVDLRFVKAKTATFTSGSTTASSIDVLDLTSATALTFAGSSGITIAALTLAANAAIETTGTGAVKISNQLDNSWLFKGGPGNDNITIGATTKAQTMGAGNDTVTSATGTLGTGGSVDAGDGTDILAGTEAILAALSVGTTAAKFTNFETLMSTDKLNDGTVIDVSNFNTIVNFVAGQGVTATKTATVSHLGANATVELAGALGTNTGTLIIDEAVNTSADVLNLKLNPSFTDNNDSTSSDVGDFVERVQMGQIETLNVQSTGKMGTIAAPVADYKADFITNTLVISAGSALKTLNVTGDQAFLYEATTSLTTLNTVNAAAATPAGTFTILSSATYGKYGIYLDLTDVTTTGGVALTGATGASNYLLGSQKGDTIVGGTKADFIFGFAGGDTLTGGTGNDIFWYSNVEGLGFQSNLVALDTITDFSANTVGQGAAGAVTSAGSVTAAASRNGDVIDLTSFGGATISVGVMANAADAQIYLQNLGDLNTFDIAAALDASTGRLYIDTDQNGSIDMVIQLNGVSTLTAAAFLV